MTGDWTSRCGGKQWRTLPDRTVEIAGAGVPLHAPGSKAYQIAARVWRNWKRPIRAAAKRTGVPPSWLVGIISAETGNWSENPAVQASCGPWSTLCRNPCCAGLMQINVAINLHQRVGGYPRAEDMLDPKKNIDTGSKLIAAMAPGHRWELPAVASNYNAGAPRGGETYCSDASDWGMKSDPGYIGRVIAFNNTAVRYLGVNKPELLVAYLGAGAVIGSLALLASPRLLRWARR